MSTAPLAPPITGWDCHTHLLGPYDRFPLAASRSYTPPEALEDQHAAMLARQGLSHAVLVHPSAYGDDYALLFHALSRHPHLRGVIVARPDSPVDLAALRERGVRAARYSHRSGSGGNFAGSASIDDLRQMASTVADAGLHVELWTDCRVLPDIAPLLASLPCPVVIDHMGDFDVAAGVDDPGFRQLLRLLERGHAWVKLSAYRSLRNCPDPEAGRPFHQRLVEANPEQLVWGSDWPHIRVDPAPDTRQLFETFERWTDDEPLRRRILIDNPTRLYA
ncbi:MAG: amidohydrolase family protein [Pigmentiphaga sp.]|uniref:amidohydrolase family protein n=1 Tax=Pigmentiphaga sp. TaxID=1977564 RepID=UPI0029A6229B|nr:amidohydrolase family protein [Pigmentiphaga sp.]MDX3907020.1 amidohydrolase family protein [Pigmentiphaga sp.]